MRSRSASTKAAAMVRNSLLRPLPLMSPPRSSSRAERNMRQARVDLRISAHIQIVAPSR
jgi:hypothetical protein